MNKQILKHYLEFSIFTNPGLYKSKLKKDLPNDIKKIGNLVRASFIHGTTLRDGNTGTNSDKKYGDMTKIPWWQQKQDDYLVTVSAILAELYKKDKKGFSLNKKETDKLIITCRFVAITMAAILKSKNIPCRVRSGFASYFSEFTKDTKSWDHWINQYWDRKEKRWITIDVDGSWHNLSFNPYDIPSNKFDFSADAWLKVRAGETDEHHFNNSSGASGIYPLVWELVYDFHCLMNNEIPYTHGAKFASELNYNKKPIEDIYLKKLDNLAKLMVDPDKNFEELKKIWESDKELRILIGGLL